MSAEQEVLYIEDDPDDAFLLRHAFEQAGVEHRLVVVKDGTTAMDYFAGRGPYANRTQHPLPCLVLLDLKMPGISGLDVLRWIRTAPDVWAVPVVVLTSSFQESDVHHAYLRGANGYLVKPSKVDELVTMAKAIKDYWLVQNRGTTWVQMRPEP
jgi:CheY-like chemotaxis protein